MGGSGGRGGYGADFGDMSRGGSGGPGGCVVLLISNIPEELANVTNIFNMVGMYGDVVAVKILRNKTDCCMVQLAKPHHAQQVGVTTIFHAFLHSLSGEELLGPSQSGREKALCFKLKS